MKSITKAKSRVQCIRWTTLTSLSIASIIVLAGCTPIRVANDVHCIVVPKGVTDEEVKQHWKLTVSLMCQIP